MQFLRLEKPAPSLEDVITHACEAWKLEGEFETLPSERDLNFRITGPKGPVAVFKIANAQEPRAMLDLEIAALDHVSAADPGLPAPRALRARNGEAVTQLGPWLVHALSWLPGEIVGERVLDEGTLYGLGRLVARLGRALRGFFHPAAGGRHLLWDNAEAPALLPHLKHLPPGEAAIVRDVIERFRDRTLPLLKRQRAQVVHADAHPYNVLLGGDGKPSGIIDFGDIIHGALAQDFSNLAADFLGAGTDNAAIISALAAGYRSLTPFEAEELAILPSLMEVRLVQTVVINAVRAQDDTVVENYLKDLDARTFPVLEELKVMGDERLAGLISGTARARVSKTEDVNALLERRKAVMGSRLYLFYDPPLHMVRGEGVWLFDGAGRVYLDCYNNVPHVGHCHPRVAEAIAAQAKKLNTNTRYVTDEAIEYAERLAATCDPSLSAVVFVNSGSEANDVAFRMAKAWTGRSGGLCMDFAYHGITEATDAFSPSNVPDNALKAHMRALPPPDDYRGPYRRGEENLAEKYAKLGALAISDLAQSSHGVAACMIDSAFMTNGMLEAPEGYVRRIAEKVRAAGGLFIADEVQSGFGRMGTSMWGHQHHGVTPDFITIGKPAGNGHPLGVVITRPEILDHFTKEAAFFSTFGGNNVSCAAGLAVLDVIRDEGLIENARVAGAALKSALRGLMRKHTIIGDVRGTGLALGIELVKDRKTLAPAPEECRRLQSLIRDEGVLVGGEGIHGNNLKVRPPIVFKPEHAEIVAAAMDRAMAKL